MLDAKFFNDFVCGQQLSRPESFYHCYCSSCYYFLFSITPQKTFNLSVYINSIQFECVDTLQECILMPGNVQYYVKFSLFEHQKNAKLNWQLYDYSININ